MEGSDVRVGAAVRDADDVDVRPTGDLYRLIEHASDYVVAVDAACRFSYVSPSVERDLGYPADAVLGVSVLKAIHPADVPMIASALAEAAEKPTRRAPMLIRILRAVAPPGIRSTVRNAVAHEPDPGVRGLAYRIGQDALAWAFERVREGEVEQEGEIAVDVETADEGTLVHVRCDACGTAASSEDDAALVSIRERPDLAGGWARVRAQESAATTLEFWLPERLTGAS
jgi:PAS fold